MVAVPNKIQLKVGASSVGSTVVGVVDSGGGALHGANTLSSASSTSRPSARKCMIYRLIGRIKSLFNLA